MTRAQAGPVASVAATTATTPERAGDAAPAAAPLHPTTDDPGAAGWEDLPARLRDRGLRWTPQRATLLAVLATTSGHVTGSELVERCRALDPGTIPSTVYRTLDVLEELGVVRHAHGIDGREEFHVRPTADHGHLHCARCNGAWEIGQEEARTLVDTLEQSRGFAVNLSHLSIAGICAGCRAAPAADG